MKAVANYNLFAFSFWEVKKYGQVRKWKYGEVWKSRRESDTVIKRGTLLGVN